MQKLDEYEKMVQNQSSNDISMEDSNRNSVINKM